MRLPTAWHVAHLVVVASWGGLAAAEVVLELVGRRQPTLREAVARIHRVLDWFVELPLLLAILLTGGVLVLRAPHDAALWIKVGVGSGVVLSILATVWFVLQRARLLRDGALPEQADRYSGRILRVAWLAVPLFGTAMALGGRRGGWW